MNGQERMLFKKRCLCKFVGRVFLFIYLFTFNALLFIYLFIFNAILIKDSPFSAFLKAEIIAEYLEGIKNKICIVE